MEKPITNEEYVLFFDKIEKPDHGILILGEMYVPYWISTPKPIENNPQAQRTFSAGIDKILDSKSQDLRTPLRVIVKKSESGEPEALAVWSWRQPGVLEFYNN